MDFEFSAGKMIRHPDLVHYACVAKRSTVMAEFNSKDAALGAVALKCLEKTPPFHATFTHTVRSRTYTFLIDEPFVYFAIFHETMEKSEGLAFLKSVRAALAGVVKGKSLESLGFRSLQEEFNPIFRQLLGSGIKVSESPEGQRFDQGPEDLQCRSIPIVGSSNLDGDIVSRKMKNRLVGEFGIGRKNSKSSDEDKGKGVLLNREFPRAHKKGEHEMVGHQQAKKIWKKQVWIILSIDLFICLILFVIWLWICNGFKCMES